MFMQLFTFSGDRQGPPGNQFRHAIKVCPNRLESQAPVRAPMSEREGSSGSRVVEAAAVNEVSIVLLYLGATAFSDVRLWPDSPLRFGAVQLTVRGQNPVPLKASGMDEISDLGRVLRP